MSLRYTKRLLTHLKHDTYEPSDVGRLAKDLGVAEEEFDAFGQAVQELAAAGQVVWGDDNLVTLPPMGGELIGVFKRNPRGFGFIIPKEANAHGDLFVPAHATLDAMMEHAAANPRTVSYGEGAQVHLGVFKAMAKQRGAEFKYVWFNSGGDIANAQIGGHVDASAIGAATAAFPAIQSGKLRALASLGPNPVPGLPDLKGVGALGSEFSFDIEFGIALKAGTDESRRARWEEALRGALQDPGFLERMSKARFAPLFKPGMQWQAQAERDAEGGLVEPLEQSHQQRIAGLVFTGSALEHVATHRRGHRQILANLGMHAICEI